jgi:hypothetical protein
MRVASCILSTDPNFNGVYDRVFIPVAPAFGTLPVSAPSAAAAGGLEVGQEVLVRLHGDDAPALRPDLREQRDEQPPALGGLGLQLPERGEVAEQLLRAWPLKLVFGVQGRRVSALVPAAWFVGWPESRAELAGDRKGEETDGWLTSQVRSSEGSFKTPSCVGAG